MSLRKHSDFTQQLCDYTPFAKLFNAGCRNCQEIGRRVPVWIQDFVMKCVDSLFAVWPQQVPTRQALESAKIIAHRGEHDNISIFENTLAAFDQVLERGIWGIECDIRWTHDLVPVIIHDPSGYRVFGKSLHISQIDYTELREEIPLIPTLAEVIDRYGGKMHLMIELKDEFHPEPQQQKQILSEQLSKLVPGRDYHFLSLDPELFERVDFVPAAVCYPVSETNASVLSWISIERKLGGLTGHFLLLTNQLKRRHELADQTIGTGFITSKNCLFRELNRGIEWIFTNHALKLKKIRDEYLHSTR